MQPAAPFAAVLCFKLKAFYLVVSPNQSPTFYWLFVPDWGQQRACQLPAVPERSTETHVLPLPCQQFRPGAGFLLPIDLPGADDVEPVLRQLPWVAAWFRASSIVQLLLQLYSNGYTAIDRYFIMWSIWATSIGYHLSSDQLHSG